MQPIRVKTNMHDGISANGTKTHARTGPANGSFVNTPSMMIAMNNKLISAIGASIDPTRVFLC